MLGRGVKRKHGCSEASARERGDGVRSDCPPGRSLLPYLQQRQLVLSLCLDKLQGCQALPGCQARTEPSLCRSVLLANTLRQIQEEMRREGEDTPTYCATMPPCRAATPLHTSDLLVATQPRPPADPSLLCDMASEGEALTCPRCAEEEDLDVSLFPSPFSCSSSSSSSGETLSADPRTLSLSSLLGSFEAANSPGYLSDLALDDIFEDIDTSMYDPSDVSSILTFCPSRGAAHPSGEHEGLKPPLCYPSPSPLQLCLTDTSDLDYIMEVLVGS